jgi:hypothetical protein
MSIHWRHRSKNAPVNLTRLRVTKVRRFQEPRTADFGKSRVVFATKWKHEEKSCRDTLATVATVSSRQARVLSWRQLRQAKHVSWRLCCNCNRKTTAWQQFCDNQGGGKGPLWGTVFVFLKLPPAACMIPGYEINLRQCHDSWKQAKQSFTTNTSRDVRDS